MDAPTVLAALDFEAAWQGMTRDVSELTKDGGWPVIAAVFLLPIASVALLLRRRWLGVIPLLASVTTFLLWFLYYAIDLWDEVWDEGVQNQDAGEVVLVALFVLIGWLVVPVAALLRPGLRGQLGRLAVSGPAPPHDRPPDWPS